MGIVPERMYSWSYESTQQLPQSLLLKIKRSVWIGDEKNKEIVCSGAVRVAVQ
jgi:hypothetical protein